jgi:hypothetical protein
MTAPRFAKRASARLFVSALFAGRRPSRRRRAPLRVRGRKHHFQVGAGDAAGNVDPTPAEFTWLLKKPH